MGLHLSRADTTEKLNSGSDTYGTIQVKTLIPAKDLFDIKKKYEGDMAVEKYREKCKSLQKLEELNSEDSKMEENDVINLNEVLQQLDEHIVESLKNRYKPMKYKPFNYGISLQVQKYIKKLGYIVDFNQVESEWNDNYMLKIREDIGKKMLKNIYKNKLRMLRKGDDEWITISFNKDMEEMNEIYNLDIYYDDQQWWEIDFENFRKKVDKDLGSKYFYGRQIGQKKKLNPSSYNYRTMQNEYTKIDYYYTYTVFKGKEDMKKYRQMFGKAEQQFFEPENVVSKA